jgi:DUF4097 and DUF4098 domain-containing protein YvlB
MKVKVKEVSKLAAITLAALPLAWAQQTCVYQDGRNWTQEATGSLENARNLNVNLDAGTVRVEGGSYRVIRYVASARAHSLSEEVARRELASCKVHAFVKRDTAYVASQCSGKQSLKLSGEFVISVPREMQSVKIHTGAGRVIATGIVGNVDAQSGGGVVRLDNIGGSVTVQTGGDKVEIGTIGGDTTVHSGGGPVTIGAVNGRVNASTGGGPLVLKSSRRDAVLKSGAGDIQVSRCGGQLSVSTMGGNIDVGDVSGPVEAESGGGSIRLASAQGPVHAKTSTGQIELNGVPAARVETGYGAIVARFISGKSRPDSSLETSLGDVTVYLAPNLNVTVRASVELADGHTIRSDFPEIQIRTEGEVGGKTVIAQGNLNGGGPLLKIQTATSNIHIVRGQ